MRFRFALALISFLIPMLLAEAFLRIRGSETHDFVEESSRISMLMQMQPEGKYLTLPPGQTIEGWGHEIRLNRFGMRDPEPTIPKPEGTRRILVLGDSFAFGHGVAVEEAVPALLREGLVDREVDLISAAMPGWNTLEQERFLSWNFGTLEPDLVLILYVINDREPDNPYARTRYESETLGGALYRSLLLKSRLFEWIVFTSRKRWVGSEVDPMVEELILWAAYQGKEKGPDGFSTRDRGWRKSRDALLRMHRGMQEQGGDLVVFLLRDTQNERSRAAHEALVEVADRTGLDYVDSLAFYGGRNRRDVVLIEHVNPHPNALGHRLLAAGIAENLRDRGWLTPK